MGDIKTAGDTAWRDWTIPNTPSSGEREPAKSEIREFVAVVDEKVESIEAGNGMGLITFATTSARNAFVHASETEGLTAQDLENGNTYRSDGSAWVLIGESPATRLVAVENDIDTLDGRLDTAESDIAALEVADVSLDARLDKVEGAISSPSAWELAGLWSGAVAGEPADRARISEDEVVLTGQDGLVIAVTGAARRAPRAVYRLLLGRKYEVLAAARRATNPIDPLGDSVSLRVAWLNASKGEVALASLEDFNLLTSSGLHVFRKVVSLSAGDEVDEVAPNGTVYFTPFVETYGEDGVTRILTFVRVTDLTSNTLVSADVSGLTTRVTALETLDAGTRLEALESITATPETAWFGSVADAEAATIPGSVDRVMVFGTSGHFVTQYLRDVAGDFQSDDGQWWVVDTAAATVGGGGVYAAKDLGVVSGGSDQLSAVTAAIARVSTAGGGSIMFEPGTYVFSDRFDLLDGVKLQGVKGKTVFDFSSMSTWENSVENGLIRAFGSLGTPVALTQRAIRPQTKALRLTGTRSGTTITFESDIAHGYTTGDPVWVEGAPATAGQAVFFTVNRLVGATAKTVPFIVATVLDSTHFTVAVADTGDTTLSTVAYSYRASDVIIMGSTAGFSAGDDVQIRSAAYRSDGSSEQTHIGEFGKVARILSATMLLLHSSVQDDYLVSDTAQVVKVNFLEGVAFSGIHLIGNGPKTDSGYGDRGFVARFCRNPIVEDFRVTDCDQMGVYLWSCLGGAVRNFEISFNASDESGQSSGSLDIQYGVAHGGCDGLVIADGVVIGGRHGVVESMTSSATYFGVSRNITTRNVTCRGQWLAAFSSHQGIDNWTIEGCTVEGAETGVNPRFCRNVQIVNLNARCFKYGVQAYNVVESLIVTGGFIEAGIYPIRVDQGDQNYGSIKVDGVHTRGGEYGVYIVDSTTGRKADNVEVLNCTVEDTKYAGIRVTVGNTAEVNDGWYGKINNNTLINVGQGSIKYAVWLTNCRGGQCNDNVLRGASTLAYYFYITGAGTADFLQFYDNTYTPGLLSVVFFCDGGYLHRTNMTPTAIGNNTATISSGLLSPRIAGPVVAMDTESGASTDDLTDIRAGQIGMELTLYSVGGGTRVITVKDNAGNIQCGSDFVWATSRDLVRVVWNGTAWCAVGKAAN